MPSSISLNSTYSSAVCERDDSPTPIFNAANPCIMARSEVVGEMNVLRPIALAALTNGWSSAMAEARTRVERGFASPSIAPCSNATTSSFE